MVVLLSLAAALLSLLCCTDAALAAPPAPIVTSPAQGAYTSESEPVFAGSAEDEIDPVVVNVYAGPSASGSPVQTLQSLLPPLGGGWSLPSDAVLPDGEYTAVAEQTELLTEESSSSAPVSFVVDTAPPEPSTDPVPSPTGDPTPTLAGSGGTAAGDEAKVTVTLHRGASVGGAVAVSPQEVEVSGGHWSTQAPHLADGTYTIEATQSDKAGNTGEAQPVTFVVDTSAPTVSIESVGAPSKDSSPTLEGHAGTAAGDAESVTVTVRRGAEVVVPAHAVAVAGDGSWSYTTPALEDGSYTAEVTQEDQAGNAGHDSTSFAVDTTVPVVSLDAVATPSNDATPMLEGGGGIAVGDDAGVTVTVHVGGSVGGAVVASHVASVSGGKWSWATSTLADGTYTVQAMQGDKAGNTGEATPVSFVVDTKAPSVSIEEVPSPSKDATPELAGTGGVAAGDLESVSVTIHAGATVGGPVVAGPQAVAIAEGKWSLTSPQLGDGTYTAQVTQHDKAGNAGVASTTFAIDTTAPVVTLEHPTGKTAETVARPLFAGKRGKATGDQPAVTLKVYQGFPPEGAPVESKVIEGGGSDWSTGAIETPLESGQIYTAIAEQKDDAGNVGRSEVVFTVLTERSPTVTISSQGFAAREGEWASRPGPTISGTAGTGPEDGASVTVRFKREGVTVKTLTAQRNGGEWSLGPVAGLEEGPYLLVAEQSGPLPLEPGTGHLRLTIDGHAPAPSVTLPADGSSSTSSSVQVIGTAGSAPGDSGSVAVRLYRGSTTTESPPVSTLTPLRAGNSWSGSFEAVTPGTYTVQAEQADDVGNLGLSATSTFTVGAVPPVASFQWIPSEPQVGETISLVSTSTDAANPITGFAWDLSDSGAFTTGASIAQVKFTTAGNHVVHLRVTDSVGAEATAAETIAVSRPAAVLMSPFPIVRIAGRQTAAGARIALLTVQAPLGATVSIACRGKGCPVKSVSLLATLSKHRSKAGTVLLAFPRFERGLRAGVVLEIRVSRAGQIGKYTRFSVRLGKLPKRVDMCLSATGVKPIVCPS